jgi:hypothetical protein
MLSDAHLLSHSWELPSTSPTYSLHPEYLFSKDKFFSNIQITKQTGVTLMLLTRIWGLPGWNPSQETDHPDRLFALFLIFFIRIPGEYLNQAMTPSFQILSKSSLTNQF